MLMCYGSEIGFKERQEQNFKKAKTKLENKMKAINMLINNCGCSEAQRKQLREFYKSSLMKEGEDGSN